MNQNIVALVLGALLGLAIGYGVGYQHAKSTNTIQIGPDFKIQWKD